MLTVSHSVEYVAERREILKPTGLACVGVPLFTLFTFVVGGLDDSTYLNPRRLIG